MLDKYNVRTGGVALQLVGREPLTTAAGMGSSCHMASAAGRGEINGDVQLALCLIQWVTAAHSPG